jgi:L-threonylcarbamoyladenylate synthase
MIIKINETNFKETLQILEDIIKNGGLAIVPTDTVYGIICDGKNLTSKQNIFNLKGRTVNKTLIGFVENLQSAEKFAYLPENFLDFIKNKWPGKNTFVLKSKVNLTYLSTTQNTIGLRIPDFQLINKLNKKIEIIASTSANISGEKSASCLDEISKKIKEGVDICIDAGKIYGKASSVWDLTGEKPIILRKG